MNSSKPVSNRLLQRKWAEQEHILHLKKLLDMKSSFQVSSPQRYKHLDYKPKKYQLQEGK